VTSAAFPVVLDEFAYYCFGANKDELIAKLRSMPNVPPVTYLVRDGKVFVFDALVSLVERGVVSFEDIDESKVDALLPRAWVSPEEAVETWKVTPLGYEMVVPQGTAKGVDSDAGITIQHSALRATLPGVYANEADARKALAKRLVGEVLPGPGDFVFQGQAMTPNVALDVQSLGEQPTVFPPHSDFQPESFKRFHTLSRVAYVNDSGILSESDFDVLVREHHRWNDVTSAAFAVARDSVQQLWRHVFAFRFETLAVDAPAIDPQDTYRLEELAEARSSFPELWMLTGAQLLTLVDEFVVDALGDRKSSYLRNDDLIFYLIGKLAAPEHFTAGERADVGRFATFAMMEGFPISDAMSLAISWMDYERRLLPMARQVNAMMTYLADVQTQPNGTGRSVRTVSESFAGMRSLSFTAHMVTQEETLKPSTPSA